MTKKEIAQKTKVMRLKGFRPRFKYFYKNKRFQFSGKTEQILEVWDKSHKGSFDSYPGQYFNAPTSKKDFVNFVYWYLTTLTKPERNENN